MRVKIIGTPKDNSSMKRVTPFSNPFKEEEQEPIPQNYRQPQMAYGGAKPNMGTQNGIPIRSLDTSWDYMANVNRGGDQSLSIGAVGKNLPEAKNGMGNINAEKEEQVMGDFNGDGMPVLMNVDGKPHTEGGKDIAVPQGAFVFSDTKALQIKDKDTLKIFGESSLKTPAQIAKKYDLQKYKKIIDDKNADEDDKRTAVLMYENYTNKLNLLASVQESMKEKRGLSNEQVPQHDQEQSMMSEQQEQGIPQPSPVMQKYGGLQEFQGGGPGYQFGVTDQNYIPKTNSIHGYTPGQAQAIIKRLGNGNDNIPYSDEIAGGEGYDFRYGHNNAGLQQAIHEQYPTYDVGNSLYGIKTLSPQDYYTPPPALPDYLDYTKMKGQPVQQPQIASVVPPKSQPNTPVTIPHIPPSPQGNRGILTPDQWRDALLGIKAMSYPNTPPIRQVANYANPQFTPQDDRAFIQNIAGLTKTNAETSNMQGNGPIGRSNAAYENAKAGELISQHVAGTQNTNSAGHDKVSDIAAKNYTDSNTKQQGFNKDYNEESGNYLKDRAGFNFGVMNQFQKNIDSKDTKNRNIAWINRSTPNPFYQVDAQGYPLRDDPYLLQRAQLSGYDREGRTSGSEVEMAGKWRKEYMSQGFTEATAEKMASKKINDMRETATYGPNGTLKSRQERIYKENPEENKFGGKVKKLKSIGSGKQRIRILALPQ